MSVDVGLKPTSAVKSADPDFGTADPVEDALTALYESGAGQLVNDLIAARPFAKAPHRDRIGDVQAAAEADRRAATGHEVPLLTPRLSPPAR
jgi:hypothetical protein